jgi:hypothetical protein
MAEYWYLWLILAALIIVTAAVVFFAARAASAHSKETKKLFEELEHLKQLKNKYKNLTQQTAEEAEPFELLEGINAVMQAEIEKSENPEQTFAAFNNTQKNLYTLLYFLEDSQQNLSFFFKNNGSELREQILPALSALNEPELLTVVKSVYDMFDENNEESSLDNSELEKADKQFLTLFNKDKLLSEIKHYIINNVSDVNG